MQIRALGKRGVVTQRDKNGKILHQIECLRVGQLGLHENMLLVLEGNKVRSIIRLGDLKELHVDMRRSYKHPVIGAIIGASLIAVPVSSFMGDPLGVAGIFYGSLYSLFACLFCLGMGGFTLYEVLQARRVPWLIARTPTGEHPHALDRELSSQESQLLDALGAIPPSAAARNPAKHR